VGAAAAAQREEGRAGLAARLRKSQKALAGGTPVLVVVGTYTWWQCCVFRCWIGYEHILLGSTLTPGARSPLTVICDSKFPYWCMFVRAGGGLPKQQPKTKPTGMLCICCIR
jgi:hypothetical protein